MQRKYIKVTQKGKPSFIVLASNELFYRNLGAKIEDAEKEEIEKAFPEMFPASTMGAFYPLFISV
jgi:hypothetical protein